MRSEIKPKYLIILSTALFCARADAEQAQIEASGIGEVVVRGQRNTPKESGDNYTVKGSTSATKLDLKLKETPQSISTFTRQQMQDQNLQDLDSVLQEAPGITVLQDSITGMGEAQFYSRGFPVENYQIDGVIGNKELMGGSRFVGAQDTFLYDRIEIIRGSTGMATGVGDPSASVNFVRKRPIGKNTGQFNLKYGSWNDKRVEFDQNFVIHPTLRGRFIATWGDGNSFIDRVRRHSNTFYGTLDWSPTDKDQINIGIGRQYRGTFGAPRKGLMRYSRVYGTDGAEGSEWVDARNLPAGFNNSAVWAYNKTLHTNFFAEYKHQFNKHLKLQASYTSTRTQNKSLYGDMGTTGYAPAYNAASYEWGHEGHDDHTSAFDIMLDGHFKLFNQDQQVLAGFGGIRNVQREDYYPSSIPAEDFYVYNALPPSGGNLNHRYLNEAIPLDYWNNGDYPMLGNSIAFTAPIGPANIRYGARKEREDQYGPYFAIKFKPAERFTFILGGRRLHWKRKGGTKWENPGANKSGRREFDGNQSGKGINQSSFSGQRLGDVGKVDKFVPYGGLIVELAPDINAYASYTGIARTNNTLKTRNALKNGGGYLPPITGNSKEVGIKGGLWQDRLNFSLAYFSMTQKGYPSFMPTGLRCYKWEFNADSGENECKDGEYEYDASKGYTSRGWDINVAGRLTPKWKVQAGFVKLKIDRPFQNAASSFNDFGEDLNLEYDGTYTAPDKTFKFFTSYNLTPKFTIGAGMTRSSGIKPKDWAQTYVDGKKNRVEKPKPLWQPAYSLFNIMARYKIGKNAAVAANVGNLGNKRYYTNARSNFYGKPRHASVSLQMKW